MPGLQQFALKLAKWVIIKNSESVITLNLAADPQIVPELKCKLYHAINSLVPVSIQMKSTTNSKLIFLFLKLLNPCSGAYC